VPQRSCHNTLGCKTARSASKCERGRNRQGATTASACSRSPLRKRQMRCPAKLLKGLKQRSILYAALQWRELPITENLSFRHRNCTMILTTTAPHARVFLYSTCTSQLTAALQAATQNCSDILSPSAELVRRLFCSVPKASAGQINMSRRQRQDVKGTAALRFGKISPRDALATAVTAVRCRKCTGVIKLKATLRDLEKAEYR
jgi:hypothetical protein